MSTSTNVTATVPVNTVPLKKRKWTKKQFTVLLMFAPAAVLLLVFNYIPMYGVVIGFQEYDLFNGVFHSPWVGFDNFKFFLTDEKFWEVMRNTLIINAYDIIFGFSAPIIFALLANEIYNRKFKKVVQTISYMPNFLSWVVVAGLVSTVLAPDANGLVNMALTKIFGIKSVFFLAEISMFRPIVVIAEIWKGVGFSAILYFATIAGIDSSLYEAAYIDGANRIRQMFHVTLPGLIPMIVIMLLLRLSGIFSIGFERIFLLQNPVVLEVSEVISTYVYRIGITQAQFSLTTAIGLVQSLLGFIMLYGANSLAKKISGLGLY